MKLGKVINSLGTYRYVKGQGMVAIKYLELRTDAGEFVGYSPYEEGETTRAQVEDRIKKRL